MRLDDRGAGPALLALAGVALLAFVALFQMRAPAHAPEPSAPAPGEGPVAPVVIPAPPAPPTLTPPAPPPGPPRVLLVGKTLRSRMEGFVLRGTVRGPDGKTPVPGAAIEVVGRAGLHERFVADSMGTFTWNATDSTPAAVVWAFAPGVGFGHLFVQGAPGQSSDQDVILVALRPLSVRVESGQREGMGAARVEASPTGEDAPALPGAVWGGTTDGKGECTLSVPTGISLRFKARRMDLKGERTAEVEAAPAPARPLVILLGEQDRTGR